MKVLKLNNIKRITAVALSFVLAATLFIFVGCGEKEIDKVTVGKNPTKTEYYVGDTFSVEGGELIVTYKDGSSETVSMTSDKVTVSEVKLEVAEGEESSDKTVTVRFGGKPARFKIKVSEMMYKVTFNYGYEGATDAVVSVKKNAAVEKPADPTRTGFTFYKWYADEALTSEYDFEAAVGENTSLYAKWLDNSKSYLDVSFSYNYTGAPDAKVQKVESGAKATKPAIDPARKGYAFNGWYSDAACTTEFAFATAAVSAATTVYAKWTRTSMDPQEFVFEAEDTDLKGKVGPGLSGTATAAGMIQRDNAGLGASNGRFVGYQYKQGLTLDFFIVSDMDVTDAKIVLRLSAELRDMNIGPDNYKIMVNSRSINYTPAQFKNVPKGSSSDTAKLNALPFADFLIMENVSLREGSNSIILFVNNSNALEGTTMVAEAPLVDCLKITTKAMLTWDSGEGLPKKNY